MNEIYWLTRLDSICITLGIVIFLSAVAIFIAFIIWINTWYSDYEKDVKICSCSKKSWKISIPVFIIAVLVQVFTPNSKEAMAIWSIGSTIDYLKTNDTAKQIPDKCIKALDKFVDKYMEEDKNE